MPTRYIMTAAIRIMVILMPASPTHASADRPLWEMGVGVAALQVPDYLGSDHRSSLLLPYPYLLYRGKMLRASGRDMKGVLLDSRRVNLTVSVNASIPVNSDDSDLRRGMDDLDTGIEFGPSAEIKLWTDDDGRRELSLEVPIRALFTTDFSSIEHHGWVTNPHLTYTDRGHLLPPGWRSEFSIGPVWANDDYYDYYYGVDQRFANAARPAYIADSGYGGIRLSAYFSKRFGNIHAGFFMRYFRLDGATFEDSPLVETEDGLQLGMTMAWLFAASRTRVPVKLETDY